MDGLFCILVAMNMYSLGMTRYSMKPEIQPGAVYSIKEAADLLGMSPATVSLKVKRGELRAARLGHRTVRIAGSDILDWLHRAEARRQE